MPDPSDLFRERFRKGDTLALLECVVACKGRKVTLPDWVRDALAERIALFLDTDQWLTLDAAILGPPRRGRHADRRQAQRSADDDAVRLGAVLAAEREGLKGDAKFERARVLLARRQLAVGVDRLRQLGRKGKVNRQAALLEAEWFRQAEQHGWFQLAEHYSKRGRK